MLAANNLATSKVLKNLGWVLELVTTLGTRPPGDAQCASLFQKFLSTIPISWQAALKCYVIIFFLFFWIRNPEIHFFQWYYTNFLTNSFEIISHMKFSVFSSFNGFTNSETGKLEKCSLHHDPGVKPDQMIHLDASTASSNEIQIHHHIWG